LRREIELTAVQIRDAQAWLHHDDDVELYVNGVLALTSAGWTSTYETFSLSVAGQKALKPGKNVIAIHCHQNSGGQYIDFGLVNVSAK
jgi:hypothetical protein